MQSVPNDRAHKTKDVFRHRCAASCSHALANKRPKWPAAPQQSAEWVLSLFPVMLGLPVFKGPECQRQSRW